MFSRKSRLGLLKSFLAACTLLASGAAMAATVQLTASPQSTALPDGQTVPMWGYTCGPSDGATCTTLGGAAQSGGSIWQPPLITVPANTSLTISLVNNLSFSSSGVNVPTSIVIVGQLGGGLGTGATKFPVDAFGRDSSGLLPPQGTTWPGTLGTTNPGDPVFQGPAQEARVRSLATEVNVGAGSVALTWSSLRPGTYLIHSGTEPSIQHPMGLYGVLVVTDPAATPTAPSAYGTPFDKDVALLFSEIDPLQNREVAQVVQNSGFTDTKVWDGQPGGCGDIAQPATVHTCYPPAVNYSPRYYLVNGISFDRTNLAKSTITGPTAAPISGNVLLRLINAGLQLHVPSVVNKNMTLLAEDGNKIPGSLRTQASVALAAGKTYDLTVQPTQTTPGTYDNAALAVFDRQLSLSTANQRDGGMQAYINIGTGAAAGNVGSSASAVALNVTDKTYYCSAGTTLNISDASKGLLGGATGANGVALTAFTADVSASTLTLSPNGTFVYAPSAAATAGNACGGTFSYLVNGTASHTATIAQCDISSAASGCTLAAAPAASNVQFVSNVNSRFASPPPGVMGGVSNPGGLTLKATGAGINADGSFVATGPGSAGNCNLWNTSIGALPSGATCVKVPFTVTNVQGSAASATATVAFLPASNLVVNVKDAKNGVAVTDYRWIIEEDKTFWIDPKCQTNSTANAAQRIALGCQPLPVESLGYSFHTAHMDVVAQGCVGAISCESGQTVNKGTATACDIGNGQCVTDGSKSQKTELLPGAVSLDPNKRYFISVLPGDGVNPTIGGAGGPNGSKQFEIATACGPFNPSDPRWQPGNLGNADGNNTALCGHAMGGAQIAAGQKAVDIKLQQTPLPTAKIAVFVFQDDNPLNGENDAGGGVDTLAPNEPGLGGFEIKLFDQAGGLGDATGQITYDMFNQPVSNSLANYIDPVTGLDACPINARKDGLVGMIPTCPKYESDGVTLSPLAGQAVIANLYPGLYEIVATPAADRVARGEEWLQTNTLDGGKPHEAFIKPNEPGYFQEFGPGGFHVAIGFANPAIINARKGSLGDNKGLVCSSAAADCTHQLTVHVTNAHMSRTPDQRTFSTETYDHYSFTNCYVSVGPADAEDFAFGKCSPDGTVVFNNMPNGVFKMSVFDQWNDIMLDGLVGTVQISGNTDKVVPVTQWRTNLFTRTFIDNGGGAANMAGDGVSNVDADGNPIEPGLALVNTNIHYRDGSIGFFNNTDMNGFAGFNEVFPFMNWLVVETTSTRYKSTGVHAVYDAGGPVDGSSTDTNRLAGSTSSVIAANLANTDVRTKLPLELRIPGAKYCDNADCPPGDAGGGASTGIVFPPQAWGSTIGWQGLLGQNTFLEFGVKPFKPADPAIGTPAENGGISGMVIYASTRPFDDPALSLQLSWEPGVPRVKINLYQKTIDDSGNEKLTLVDTTTSASWDDWAQGFRRDAAGNLMTTGAGVNAGYISNISCPGQGNDSPFFATLKNSKQWLDTVDGSGNKHPIAYQSQFKCYDGWSQLNQTQPAPYDGLYKFPSVVTTDPVTGKAAQTNCQICVPNPDDGNPMLPSGKYVVEVILPPGYELVKEEDKNILLGDVYIAPVTQQFAGFGNIFIMPDQAQVNSAYNANNPGGLDKTIGTGAQPRHEGDTGSIEQFWPCVGAERIVPDLNSLFPGAGQQAPFAGAKRRLCDRKEVTLNDESSALTKFFIFSSTHVAGHFAGTITNDFAAEFDPFSPQFGEKFGPPNLPVAMRDFTGNEVARVYSDQWGIYNGLYFSSYSVNPPNPTGYVPQMSIACMNDPGPILVNGQWITDPNYNPAYSNFCYETPFMPGFTAYMDTPVIPTQAFADQYNLPDTEYPDGTPAIKSVISSAAPGPWVRAATSGASATVQLTISSVDRITSATSSAWASIQSITIGGSSITGTTPITCSNATNQCNVGGNSGAATRANNMAQQVVDRINSNTSTSGYSATRNNAVITITAPTGTYDTLNGTVLAVGSIAHVNVDPQATTLAGGFAPATAAMDITITALGDKVVQNPNYAGPNATVAPYNLKTITRHYGFGSSGTVTIGGVALTNVTWTDTSIRGTVNPTGVPACTLQQRNAPSAQCGELVITRADNGKQSIDAITVTIGGSAPWVVTANDFATNTGGSVTPPAGKPKNDYGANLGRMFYSPIQVAIDNASPGDLILVQPGTYRENLIMWKPVRLQGVGAASVTINADAHPAGKMDEWRRQVVCVFGLDLKGRPNLNNAAFDPSGAYSCPTAMFLKGDRIPFEAITGWDASGNGNLAQVLQEPTLMGAYEGAGITVLGRGVRIPANSTEFWGADPTAAGAFVDGSVYLSAGDCSRSSSDVNRDYVTSNYNCNPSRIDGVSVLNSSQGGGGVFVHGWGHNLEIANTRVSGNHGTLAGGVNLGNGETPPVFLNDGTICGAGTTTLCPPIPTGTQLNETIPFAFNTNVRIHHNMIYNNASIGDALFTGTPAGAGGITVSAGGDKYQIDHNWIAGNLSTGDGGGVQILGVNFNGRINNNYILFNQSTNPTLPTNGGGIVVQGANEPRTIGGQECGAATDFDCPPGLGDGIGRGLVIDANLILGNSAESGSGGGLRLQQVNGSEMIAFPRNSAMWYSVTVSNNIIANNVAGWDGAGVAMEDALMVTFVNNTVASNDTTASAGALFKTLGAVNASSAPPGCSNDPTQQSNLTCPTDGAPHAPQPSGLVTLAHSYNLREAIGNLPIVAGRRVACPIPTGQNFGYSAVNDGDCMKVSKPRMINDMFWHNRAFSVDVVDANGNIVSGTATPTGTGLLSQQNLIALNPMLNQQVSGQCVQPASAPSTFYYDVGLRTDDVAGGTISFTANKLQAYNSIISGDPQNVVNKTNPVTASSSPVVAEYCNGARTVPESCSQLASGLGQSCNGLNAPAGSSETTGLATVFVFNGIKPSATVDEGHNWLNLTYGPLTLGRPNVNVATAGELMVASASAGLVGGAYSIPVGSPAINVGAARTAGNGVPDHDYFNNPRAATNVDVGAVEYGAVTGAAVNVTGGPLAFGNVAQGTTSAGQTVTLHNEGNVTITGIALTFAGPFSRSTTTPGTCGTTLAVTPGTCTINVVFQPTALGSTPGQLSITSSNATVAGSPVSLTGTGVAPVVSASLTPATWTPSANRGVGALAAPTQVFTLTNTGNVALTGVAQAALGGIDAAQFTVVRLLSSCGPAGNGQVAGQTTLAPGAACAVTVQFRPGTTTTLGAKSATVSVTDAAGTQTSTLTGTAR